MGKRTLDIIGAFVGLGLSAPILIIVIIILKIKYRTNIFFRQNRLGIHFEEFQILKIRTIYDGEKIDGFCQFLRQFGIDELPQLIHVIKGEMSLVGPRPLLAEYSETLRKLGLEKRQSVKPGITGWTQIKGRNNLSWPEKFRWDLHYVENKTLLADLQILVLTILKLPFAASNDLHAHFEPKAPEAQ